MPLRALNQITAPRLGYGAFFELAKSAGCSGVELRTDLPGPLFGGDSGAIVAERAADLGLKILTMAEVKDFNIWTDEKAAEARRICDIGNACGAKAISLIPRNDGFGLGNGERRANLRVALRELKDVLDEFDMIGLLEPLGFPSSSLQSKEEAIDVIEALGVRDRIRLEHDTFHHFLAGGGPIFPDYTEIIHVSGVSDLDVAREDLGDAHRGLVDADDRLGSVRQIHDLLDQGFNGPVSFEAFSPSVRDSKTPAEDVKRSFDYIFSSSAADAA